MGSSESVSCPSIPSGTIGRIVAGVSLTMIFIVLIVGILMYKFKTFKANLNKTASAAAVDLHGEDKGERSIEWKGQRKILIRTSTVKFMITTVCFT